jgi:hypothetical protein
MRTEPGWRPPMLPSVEASPTPPSWLPICKRSVRETS